MKAMLAKDCTQAVKRIKIDYEENPSLYLGNGGLFLFELLASRLTGDATLIAQNVLGSQYTLHTLCGGKAGVNWLFEYLTTHYDLIDRDTLSFIRRDDTFLKKVSLENLAHGNYDFMHGSIGIAYYLLYNPEIIDRDYQKGIILGLQSQFERNGYFLYKSTYDESPDIRKVSMGLSHGLPSIIRYLAECVKHNLETETAKSLCEKLINQLLSYRNQDISKGSFPTMVYPDQQRIDSSSRLAWCYGDIGLGISLYYSAKILEDNELKNYAEEILLHSTKRRDVNEVVIWDAGICHGSAGAAHVYNKMWHETKDIRFKEACDFWIQKTLDFGERMDGKIEFKKYNPVEKTRQVDYSLLEGNAGIGLVLYSYLTGDFSWDYCLMLND